MIAELLEHTRVQFSQTAEEQYAHLGPERLITLDGNAIDEGTPTQDAGTIDAEDYAVLFELDRLRAERNRGRPTEPRTYDILVIDEAQEFAPLELALIGRSVAPGGTLIVAGDADQQIDTSACFTTWEQTMVDLGHSDYERAVLAVSYRCPSEVVAIARHLIGTNPTTANRDAGNGYVQGDQVPCLPFFNECHLATWLMGELRRLLRRDRRASVAVICRSTITASRLSRVLRHGVDVRLVLDGCFSAHGGVHVSVVEQVKGLEFDYVVIPDCSEHNYPDTPRACRALYVAVTRARHQLVLAAVGRVTPLLGCPIDRLYAR